MVTESADDERLGSRVGVPRRARAGLDQTASGPRRRRDVLGLAPGHDDAPVAAVHPHLPVRRLRAPSARRPVRRVRESLSAPARLRS
jgi:hypothetical protein